MKKKNVWILFLIGFIFRFFISFIDYSGDLSSYTGWAKFGFERGFSGIYDLNLHILYGYTNANYPPLIMLLFYLVYSFYQLIGNMVWRVNLAIPAFPSQLVLIWQSQKNILPAFLKIPAIISDIGIAYVVYLIVQRHVYKNSGKPILFASLVLFNPGFFYNSSYWGQIESLPLFFILSALYLLIYKNKPVLSAVFMTLALLSKQTTAIFIPLYALIFVRKISIKKVFYAFVSSLAVFLAFFLPFSGKNNFLTYPFITYWNKIMTAFGSEYLTAHAFNFWGLMYGLGHIPDSKVVLFGLSVRWWSLIYVYLIMSIILFVLHKKNYQLDDIFMAGFLIALSVFLFSTRMHERHISNVLPFALVSCFYNRKLIPFFLFISFYTFFNLYSGWWSPRFEPIIGVLSNPVLVNILIIGLISGYFILFMNYAYKKR